MGMQLLFQGWKVCLQMQIRAQTKQMRPFGGANSAVKTWIWSCFNTHHPSCFLKKVYHVYVFLSLYNPLALMCRWSCLLLTTSDVVILQKLKQMLVIYFKVFAELEDNAGRKSSSKKTKNKKVGGKKCEYLNIFKPCALANVVHLMKRWRSGKSASKLTSGGRFVNRAPKDILLPLSSITNGCFGADSPRRCISKWGCRGQ